MSVTKVAVTRLLSSSRPVTLRCERHRRVGIDAAARRLDPAQRRLDLGVPTVRLWDEAIPELDT